MNAPVVETKVVAGSGAAILVGLLSWALVTFIPAWHGAIPVDLQPFIPVAAAWLISTYASYRAPHTHRPDLAPVVLPPGTVMTPVGPVAPAELPPATGPEGERLYQASDRPAEPPGGPKH